MHTCHDLLLHVMPDINEQTIAAHNDLRVERETHLLNT